MSFLDEIKAEQHAHLIEHGNMPGMAPPKTSCWTGDNQWTDEGLTARLLRSHCACGVTTPRLLGIFHRFSTPSGKIREQALLPGVYPLSHTVLRKTITETENVSLCPHCLTTKGF